MLAATTVVHDADQLQADARMHALLGRQDACTLRALLVPAPECEEPLNPQLRWEDPGVEEVGDSGDTTPCRSDEESDHVTTLAGLLEIGTLVTCRLMTLQGPGIANSGRVTGTQV